MSVRLNETETIVDRMVNFFVEHEDLRTKVSRVEPPLLGYYSNTFLWPP